MAHTFQITPFYRNPTINRMALKCLFCMPEMVPLSVEAMTVIHEERLIFLEMTVSVTNTEREKEVNTNVCLILNGYQVTAASVSIPNSFRFLFVRLNEEPSLQKKRWYKKRTDRSHFGCCCQHKETFYFILISNQNNTYPIS